MTALLLLTVKASLVLAVALAVTLLLKRRSAALRHWVLGVGLLCAAAMPALQWLAPAWTLPDVWPRSYAVSLPLTTLASSAATVTDVNPASTSAQPPTASVSWTTWLVAAWLSGAAGALAVLLAGLWRVRRVLRHTVPLTEPRVVESPIGSPPASKRVP